MVLAVWVLREMPPVAAAGRYALTVLVTVVEGYVVLRPDAGWGTGVGVVLLAAGGVGLMGTVVQDGAGDDVDGDGAEEAG